MDTHKLSTLYYLSMLTLIIVFLFLGYVSVLLFTPFKEPIVVQPFEVLNEDKTVAKGDILYFEAVIEKFSNPPTDFISWIECKDGNLVTITNPDLSPIPVGKHMVTGSQVIPQKTSIGQCKLLIESTYHVTKLKDVTATRETEWFTVIEAYE